MHTQMTQQIEKFNLPAVSLKQVNEKPLTYCIFLNDIRLSNNRPFSTPIAGYTLGLHI